MRMTLRIATSVAMAVAGCAQGKNEPFGGPPDAAGADGYAPHDGALPDVPAGCRISAGVTPVLDGINDLADYPSAQQVPLFASLGSGDGAALAWDARNLYLTVGSPAFSNAYEPLHVYLQAAAAPLA